MFQLNLTRLSGLFIKNKTVSSSKDFGSELSFKESKGQTVKVGTFVTGRDLTASCSYVPILQIFIFVCECNNRALLRALFC